MWTIIYTFTFIFTYFLFFTGQNREKKQKVAFVFKLLAFFSIHKLAEFQFVIKGATELHNRFPDQNDNYQGDKEIQSKGLKN